MNELSKPQSLLLAILLLTLTTGSLLSGYSSFIASAQTAPSVSINSEATYTNSTDVKLTLTATAVVDMRFSNDNSTWSDWETYGTEKNWTLTSDEGDKTVYAQFRDSTSVITQANADITLDLTPPTAGPYMEWVSIGDKEVYFDGSYSTDNYGISSYFWDFGDGTNATGITTNHTYAEAGNYTGYLLVKDFAGNIGGSYFYLRVPTEAPTATPTPTAEPTATPTYPPTSTPIPTTTPQPTPIGINLDMSTIAVLLAVLFAVIIIIAVVVLTRQTRKN